MSPLLKKYNLRSIVEDYGGYCGLVIKANRLYSLLCCSYKGNFYSPEEKLFRIIMIKECIKGESLPKDFFWH